MDVGRAPPAPVGSGLDGSFAGTPTGTMDSSGQIAGLGAPVSTQPQSLPGQQSSTLVELAQLKNNMDQLSALKTATQDAAQKDTQLQKQVELLQKQIDVQQKMIQLLLDQVQKQPLAGTPVEKLQTDVATLEARSSQAAQRDQEIAQAIDNIVEHQDALERYGPDLPARSERAVLTKREQRNASEHLRCARVWLQQIPWATATTAANGAGRPSTPGGFYFGEFTPDFLLKLNDWIFLEAEIGIGARRVGGRRILCSGGFLRQRLADDHRRPIRCADRLV